MSNSVDYVFPKEQSIKQIKDLLEKQGAIITEEKEINNGLGYKFNCFMNAKFAFIIYFKSGVSSKIVFENTPDEIKEWFFVPSQDQCAAESAHHPTIPVYISIRISSLENREAIHNKLHEMFDKIDESKPKETIVYKDKIEKDKFSLTITQFSNGTLLIQGTDSPLVSSAMAIIQSINPITAKENTLMYIPEAERETVAAALEKIPVVYAGLYDDAKIRVSSEAFDFLFDNDKQTLVSAVGILKAVKETDLKIPLYNPVLYPFAKVFEGFMIRLMIEKCFFTLEAYQANYKIADIGNALRDNKFKKYIKDAGRDINILDKLRIMWEDLRCHELHSDPAHNPSIVNLTDIQQVENRIGEISSSIMDAYRILVKYGYTEAEMLAQKNVTQEITVQKKIDTVSQVKEIPVLASHIGTDESGKGDYFGPLVIAGVYVNTEDEKRLLAIGVQDSKKNSDTKNRELAGQIRKALGEDKISIIYIMPEKYNELYAKMKNLNTILAWGHARAIENILAKNQCDDVIADQFGDESFINKALMEKGKKINLLQTPKAERDIAVAAASILARDKYLEQLSYLQKNAGIILYKGASPDTENAAKQVVNKFGRTELSKYVKIHFKTTERVLK